MHNKRRTQAERRSETHKKVLNSACSLFGKHGYANTSLEDIAADCGLTTRPIYHYFGNKKALFSAVNDAMEQRISQSLQTESTIEGIPRALCNWRAFLSLCDDPGFRRIVLIDSPNILGRERWTTSEVSLKAKRMFNPQPLATKKQHYRSELLGRIVMGAFTEATLMIAEAQDITIAKEQADLLVTELFGHLST